MSDELGACMKTKLKTIPLDGHGIDDASQTIQQWLADCRIKQKDILRIRLTAEEMLSMISSRSGDGSAAELRLVRRLGSIWLSVRYGGERYDPTIHEENALEEWSAEILSRTGVAPGWRWNNGGNELLFRVRSAVERPELIMLCSLAAAVILGLLGGLIPDAVKTAVTDFALSFLADAFLNLLNVFVGLMVLLSIVTGICGIGSAASFSRVGKLMISRYLLISLVLCGFYSLFSAFVFHVGGGVPESGGSQLHSILQVLFSIIPTDPFSPFISGNTLQIVFLGVVIGLALLFIGDKALSLRNIVNQLHDVIIKTVSVVCLLLPVYIFASLLMQFWTSGADLLLSLWKPLLFCIVLAVVTDLVYLFITCRRLKVKASVLCRKLIPSFLITLTTASSSAAFSTALEINDKELGIRPELSRAGLPIGVLLCSGPYTLLYVVTSACLAEHYGVSANIAWWVVLCVLSWLLSMATPPVAGATIACLSIMFLQLNIPRDGLATAATLALFLDFICTAMRMPTLHMELALEADRLGMLDHEKLRK